VNSWFTTPLKIFDQIAEQRPCRTKTFKIKTHRPVQVPALLAGLNADVVVVCIWDRSIVFGVGHRMAVPSQWHSSFKTHALKINDSSKLFSIACHGQDYFLVDYNADAD
jgi:hypothetical protein